ncbi:MAG: site-2 protease family protein [Candidatus Hydrogenedentota bacterium]
MLTNILVFLLVLGVLVFVHEAGHFLAAKACGVYVDRFSLGMPPRIFGFKWGETDYCIGLLPIGGYVKMAGQEDAPLSDEERKETYGHVPPERWYNNKSKLQRAFILIAGPAMNFVLGFIIYAGIGAFGADIPAVLKETRVGAVTPDSPASQAPMYLSVQGQSVDFKKDPDTIGWQTGDRILTIDGTTMTGFQDIFTGAVLSGGKEVTVEIERTTLEGDTTQYVSRIRAEKENPDSKFGTFGIDAFMSALIEHVLPGSPAEEHGLLSGDRIIKSNGQWVDSTAFRDQIQELDEGQSLTLEVERDGEIIELQLFSRRNGMIKDIFFDPPLNLLIAIPDEEPLKISEITEAFSSRTGLASRDEIMDINGSTKIGTEIRQLFEADPEGDVSLTIARHGFFGASGENDTVTLPLRDAIQAITSVDPDALPKIRAVIAEHGEEPILKKYDEITHIDGEPASIASLEAIERTRIGETIPITVHRPSVLFGLHQKESTLQAEITVDSIQQVGVVWRQEKIFHKEEFGNILPAAWTECVRRTDEIATILAKLFTGGLSPQLLGGPVLIFEITTQTAKRGAYEFLTTIAFISINLCIFNLLPLPVLDGGQLTIIAIEAVRRRPISMKVQETVQGAGFFLIIGLLIFVTFNDFSRIIERLLP